MRGFLNRIFQSRLLFAIILMVIFYGLFLIPNDSQSSRVWNEINNTGHIGAFLISWLFVFNLFPRFTRLSTGQLTVVVIGSTLVLAELIEIIQGWIGRDDELQDVWDSGVGAILAMAFYSVQIQRLCVWQRTVWRAVALVVLVVVPWTIWSALTDEIMIRRQFPVLCDFSTPFELSRWHTSVASMHLQKNPGSGQRFLVVEFRPAIYSTVSLEYFYPDWHRYRHIVLDVTNPDNVDLTVIVRMHDRLHKRHHFALSDRFNRVVQIKPGRQKIVFDMANVKNAPASRKMDLQHMEDLSIFTMQAKTMHLLYINKVSLE